MADADTNECRAPWRPALLGLGSNLGDRLGLLRSAVAALAGDPRVRIHALSRVYESTPMGPVAQGPFLNAAVAVATVCAPRELLELALAIERAHGRERLVRWGPRTLDIDVLWLEDVCLDEPGLTLPHPGLAAREFVLRPVADVMPELRLPDGRTAAEAAEALTEEGNDDACIPLPGADLRRPAGGGSGASGHPAGGPATAS